MAHPQSYNQKRASRLKLRGLCTACGARHSAPGRVRCAACLRLACEAQAVRHAEARGRLECQDCGRRIRIPVRCDSCKAKRPAHRSPAAVRKQARNMVGAIRRGRMLAQVFASILLLRTGRWTIAEWAAELGVRPRTVYRLIVTLKKCAVEVEVSREREHARGTATPLYTIPAEPLRRLLRM